jgi:hypothetical protein
LVSFWIKFPSIDTVTWERSGNSLFWYTNVHQWMCCDPKSARNPNWGERQISAAECWKTCCGAETTRERD